MNPKGNDIEEHLLLQYLLGNADDEDRKAVELWLQESEENRQRLDRLERLWVEAGALDPSPVAVDTDRAWKHVAERIDSFEQREPIKKKSTIPAFSFRILSSAAAMVGILFGLYLLYTFYFKPASERKLVATNIILTDSLPDGTHVSLNRNGSLIYPEKFSGTFREVKLKGEAFFEVRHDASNPFIIDAGRAKIKVLGTSFSVKADPDSSIMVKVKKGKVLFFTINQSTGDTSAIILVPGTSGKLPLGATLPIMEENPVPDDLYWADHTLDFRKTPLSEVFKLVERYYKVTIRVSDPKINRCMLSATFSNDPVEEILAVIAGSFDLKVTSSGNQYLISGDGCEQEKK